MTEHHGVNQGVPTVTQAVAAQIRAYRIKRGWSVRQLAEECAKRGAPQLTEASLGNIERGQDPDAKRKPREVTVEELLTLAYVLDARPADLMFRHDAPAVHVTADVAVHPYVAWSWLVGIDPHTDLWGPRVQSLTPPFHIYGWANIDSRLLEVEHAHRVMARAEQENEPEEKVADAREQYGRVVNRFGLSLDDFYNSGGSSLPPLPSWLMEDIRKAEAQGLIRMANGITAETPHPRTDPDGWIRARLPRDIPTYEEERPQ